MDALDIKHVPAFIAQNHRTPEAAIDIWHNGKKLSIRGEQAEKLAQSLSEEKIKYNDRIQAILEELWLHQNTDSESKCS